MRLPIHLIVPESLVGNEHHNYQLLILNIIGMQHASLTACKITSESRETSLHEQGRKPYTLPQVRSVKYRHHLSASLVDLPE